MKDDFDFTLCQPELQSEPVGVLQALYELGNPQVVFPGEIFSAGEMRQPATLHAVMRRLGYVTVMPKDGTRWRWHQNRSEFSARWAYVNGEFLDKNTNRLEVVGAEIQARALVRLTPTDSVGAERKLVGSVGEITGRRWPGEG